MLLMLLIGGRNSFDLDKIQFNSIQKVMVLMSTTITRLKGGAPINDHPLWKKYKRSRTASKFDQLKRVISFSFREKFNKIICALP